MITYLLCFTTGMLLGIIIGMCRMSLYFHEKEKVRDNYLEFGEDELEVERE